MWLCGAAARLLQRHKCCSVAVALAQTYLEALKLLDDPTSLSSNPEREGLHTQQSTTSRKEQTRRIKDMHIELLEKPAHPL